MHTKLGARRHWFSVNVFRVTQWILYPDQLSQKFREEISYLWITSGGSTLCCYVKEKGGWRELGGGAGGIQNSFLSSGEIDCPGTSVPLHWDTWVSTCWILFNESKCVEYFLILEVDTWQKTSFIVQLVGCVEITLSWWSLLFALLVPSSRYWRCTVLLYIWSTTWCRASIAQNYFKRRKCRRVSLQSTLF